MLKATKWTLSAFSVRLASKKVTTRKASKLNTTNAKIAFTIVDARIEAQWVLKVYLNISLEFMDANLSVK